MNEFLYTYTKKKAIDENAVASPSPQPASMGYIYTSFWCAAASFVSLP